MAIYHIGPSNSLYGAPILFEKKDGGFHVCIEYRAFNTNIISDSYPPPRIDEMLISLKESPYFSLLDLRDGYY